MKFEAERLYDQAGLIVLWAENKRSTILESSKVEKRKWLKAGIEFADERANLSTVAATEWADWSLLPLTTSASEDEEGKRGSCSCRTGTKRAPDYAVNSKL